MALKAHLPTRAAPISVALLAMTLLLLFGCTAQPHGNVAMTQGGAGPRAVGATPTSKPAPGAPRREAFEAAISAVVADPVHFAGLYWDPAASFPLHIMHVGDLADARARLAGLVPDDTLVEWHQVDHSYAELDRIQDEIVELWEQIDRDVIGAVSVYEPTNRVVVSTPREEPALYERLTLQYGDAVSFKIEPTGVNLICDFPEPPPECG